MSFVAFLHTYTGLGKSTFLKILNNLNKETYSIVQSDVIKDKYNHLPMRERDQKARSEFNYHVTKNQKIVLADKNFIKPKDLKYLEKKKKSIKLFALRIGLYSQMLNSKFDFQQKFLHWCTAIRPSSDVLAWPNCRAPV